MVAINPAATSLPQYNFMGSDEISVALLPYNLGLYFPAFLTHKGGVDKKVAKNMRSLFPEGIRAGQYATLLREHHALRHTEDLIKYESRLSRQRHVGSFGINSSTDIPHFSGYSDKKLYAGATPGSKYLQHVFSKQAESTKEYMDMLVKAVSGEQLSIDASYKVPRKIKDECGSMFNALVTCTNEFSQIRQQYFTVTDSHDQMNPNPNPNPNPNMATIVRG